MATPPIQQPPTNIGVPHPNAPPQALAIPQNTVTQSKKSQTHLADSKNKKENQKRKIKQKKTAPKQDDGHIDILA